MNWIAKGRELRTTKVAYLWRTGNYKYEIERTAGGLTRSTYLDASYEDALKTFDLTVDGMVVY